MQILQIPLTLEVDLLFWNSTSQKSRQGFSMSSLLLCLTNHVAADHPSPATPVTKDRPSMAIGLIPVYPRLQSLALNKRHIDGAKLRQCRQSPATGVRPWRVIGACNWHGRVTK